MGEIHGGFFLHGITQMVLRMADLKLIHNMNIIYGLNTVVIGLVDLIMFQAVLELDTPTEHLQI